MEFEPAPGDPDLYEMEIIEQRIGPKRHYFQVMVRGCRLSGECGPWSERSEPYYVPEPSEWVLLATGLGALAMLARSRRAVR